MSFVTSYLMGGLGNQMFQIAHAISHARRLSLDFFFDKKSETDRQGNQVFCYKDNVFRNIKFVDSFDVPLMRLYESDIVGQNIDNLLLNYNIEFFGYFQSEVFFQNCLDYIRDIFSPTEQFIEEKNKKYSFLNSKTVSLHIRRGDYLNLSKIHPVISESYIKAALEHCKNYDHLIIFTDDKEWAHGLDLRDAFIVEGQEDYEDLWLMSLCKNNIISNSTFSWWASFLNRNPEKKIIAPSVWLGPEEPNWEQIYSESFIKIPVVYSSGAFIHIKN